MKSETTIKLLAVLSIVLLLVLSFLSFSSGIDFSFCEGNPEIQEEVSSTSCAYVEDIRDVEESEYEPLNPVFSYTEEELDLLARLIRAESGNESYDTQLKVGSVVLNRLVDSEFPNTLREVIYQKSQFSVTTLKVNGIVMIDYPADEEAKDVAFYLLNYGSVLPQKVQVFYRSSLKSGWVTTREVYGTYDNTTFAYIYKKGEAQ